MPLETDAAETLSRLIAEVARAEILPRFHRLRADEVRIKTSPVDLVTEADESAERAITAQLRAWYPQALVVGEEAATRDPALLDALGAAPLAFLVDPVDGTRNFVAGLPVFATMLAATVQGEIVLGIIHDPLAGTTAWATPGSGAWWRNAAGEVRRLQVAAPDSVASMEAILGVGALAEPLRTRVAANAAKLRATASFRCAAHEYILAASGDLHVLMYNKLMPWDHAAGWLLHREAGGYCAHYDGTAYRPTRRTGGLLYTPDEPSWHAVREALLGDSPPA